MKVFLMLAFFFLPAFTQENDQTFALFNVASGTNYISPGCDVVVKGRGLSDFIATASTNPEMINLCSVTVGGVPALIRGVWYDAIYFTAPEPVITRKYPPVRVGIGGWGTVTDGTSLVGPRWIFLNGIIFQGHWLDVVVVTPKGKWATKVAEASVSPGLYQKDGIASGLARLGYGNPTVLSELPTKPGSRVLLLATGFRHAHKVAVYFADSELVLPAEVEPWSRSFPWLESIAFELPKEGITGKVQVVVEADGFFSNTVGFTIEE